MRRRRRWSLVLLLLTAAISGSPVRDLCAAPARPPRHCASRTNADVERAWCAKGYSLRWPAGRTRFDTTVRRKPGHIEGGRTDSPGFSRMGRRCRLARPSWEQHLGPKRSHMYIAGRYLISAVRCVLPSMLPGDRNGTRLLSTRQAHLAVDGTRCGRHRSSGQRSRAFGAAGRWYVETGLEPDEYRAVHHGHPEHAEPKQEEEDPLDRTPPSWCDTHTLQLPARFSSLS
jgi:hypothetical protein